MKHEQPPRRRRATAEPAPAPPAAPEPPPEPSPEPDVPTVCHRCGAINGRIVIYLPALGASQTIPGCRLCAPRRA